MANLDWPLSSPSFNTSRDPQYYHNDFTSALPQPTDPLHVPITRSSVYDVSYTPDTRPRSKIKPLIWPAVAITTPLALLSAALMGLVFGYGVRPQQSIFRSDDDQSYSYSKPYVLVDFSATRLVFAASFLSTVAPLLTSFIMTLWGLLASRTMSQASTTSHFERLPTPYQLSILIGLCLASMEQLRTYFGYVFSRRRKIALPPVLNRAALVFTLSVCLATAVFISDTVLHYVTSTILFDRVSITVEPTRAYGYGLSQICLDLNRIKDNSGFPCSLPVGPVFDDANSTAKYNEISRLQANISSVSQIRMTGVSGMNADVAIMIPNPNTVSGAEDYRAVTVGVATSCNLVPPGLCDLQATGNRSTFTDFHCSDNFFGMLGKAPNVSLTDGTKAEDPDLSPLSFKPSGNLQYSYFTSPNFDVIYNPESWDPNTNQPNDPEESHILPDDKLINPMYVGFAARIGQLTFTEGSSMPFSDMIFDSGNYVADFIMSCSITSYTVEYTWYKSSVHNVSATPTPNGTLIEVFHGDQVYNTVAGGAFDLQQNLVSAAIAGNDTESFLNKWQDLYSVKAMSHIGGHLTGRTNLQEQRRESVLVAKVPKPALGALIGFSLVYTVLGIWLVITAYKASSDEVHAIAEQLSLAGLTNMAFGGSKDKEAAAAITPRSQQPNTPSEGDYFSTKSVSRSETRRVKINGADFQVWV
ncbi:uncharacterized protein HMPREF1541_05775 [Cyphellophora europaea CBS 101466]|uniref:Uncharacterized protein n=1 Tax=Cyphellophora europaea (strain CBS 101466) TaxID=1220924 RepID=W2RV21_CYPE1|nr:uncharacterized protein HMPREF1541_05775 [Cyphellophora europaea CBS 101466]ETN39549.1 hypothetical protein HMPREF1541_05775 [Cyphellophora europaea CBS 101466]